DDDPTHLLEFADLVEVEKRAVDLNRRTARVFEEEDRVVEVRLPRRPDREDEVEEAPADEAAARLPTRDRNDGQAVGVLRHRARGLAAQHTQKAVAREARRRGLAEHRQARPVERREPRTRQESGVQSRDIGEAEERLRGFLDRLEVEERDRLRGSIAAAHRLDRVDLGIREGGLQVCGPHLRAAAVPVLALERAGHELYAVALLLPPGDAALDL